MYHHVIAPFLAKACWISAALTFATAVPVQADPPSNPAAAAGPQRLDWIVPFQDGGGTDNWARFVARVMAAHLPGQPEVRIRNFSGGSSTRAANYFEAEASGDGSTLLITTGSTQFAYLLGDRRVQYDYANWTVLVSGPTGGVVYVPASLGVSSMKELVARDQPLRFGSIGATSLDIVPLLAFEMLGLDVTVVLGMSSRQAARLGTERGELDIDYQTMPGWLAAVAPQAQAGQMVPLMTWGDPVPGLGHDMARDPALPDVPSFAEVYQDIHGHAPKGPAAEAWQALFAAGYSAQKMVFIPRTAAPETVALYRQALRDAMADPAIQAEVRASLGPYPIALDQAASDSLRRATTISPELRDWTRNWLKARFGITP